MKRGEFDDLILPPSFQNYGKQNNQAKRNYNV